VTPPNISFGDQMVEVTSAPKLVTVTNTATTAITITGIGISGPLDPTDFAQTNNCPVAPATLAANASCQISITFTPGGVSIKSSALSVNSGVSGGTGVPLTGTGTAGILQVDPGNLKSIAGNGTAGYAGDGGSAVAAELFVPDGVASDAQGNLYIADTGNNVIRKVDTAGKITTVAGNGTAGFSGDGGPATSAELSTPFGVTVDAAGNLYIMDSGNARIRKVNTTGTITTFAGNGTFGFSGDGGPAISAALSLIQGARFDAAGNLYVPQCTFDAVRKIDTKGIITTVAGTGTTGFSGDSGLATSAQLNCPSGVTIDAAGDFFIADTFNNRIREVNAQGIITTIAGTGTAGYSGDDGPAIAAEVSIPNDVVLDPAGDLYIADEGNNRLRKIDTTGVIATVAGGLNNMGSAGINSPDAVTVDTTGNLYFCDAGNNAVREVFPAAPPAFPGTQMNIAAAPLTITLSNIGNLPVTIASRASFALSGDTTDFSLAGGSCLAGPATLAANGGTCTLQTGFTPTALGERSVTVSVTDDAVFSPHSFQISGTGTPFGQTISFTPIANALYGVAPLAVVATATSGLPVSYTVSGPATVSGTMLTITGAGTVKVTANQAGNAEFAAATPVTRSFTVTKAALTVTANNVSRVYGAADPFLSYHITGFVNGDSGSVVLGTAKVSTAATPASPAGPYSISFSTEPLIAASYTFNYVDGTLTVTKGLLTIIANNFSRPFGAANPFLSYRVAGFVNNDPPTVVLGTAQTTTTATPTSAVGTYPITFLPTPLLAANYTFQYVNGTLTVTKTVQTITFGALANRTYGAAAFALGATASSGLPVSYTVTGPATLSGTMLTITGAGTVKVTANQAGNADYSAAASVTQSFTVAKAVLTVTANNASRAFGAANPFLSYRITGFVNNDPPTVVLGTAQTTTTATASSPAGIYPITFLATAPLLAANYTFSYVDGTLTVTGP